MNEYRWANKEQTEVEKYPSTAIVEGGYGWQGFQEYLAAGGQVDPFRTFEGWKAFYQEKAKQECQGNIFNVYPAPVQQSMALGIYPAVACDSMTLFIAACIEVENTSNDEYESCTTESELESIVIIWPEAPNAQI